jgi:hypothetical protein
MCRIRNNCVGESTIRCKYYKYYKCVELLLRYSCSYIFMLPNVLLVDREDMDPSLSNMIENHHHHCPAQSKLT